MKKALGFIAAAAMLAGAANAATVTFHTTRQGFDDNGVAGGVSAGAGFQQYAIDGLTLTVTAGMYTDTAVTGNSVVTEGDRDAEPRVWGSGTGVDHDGGNGLPNDSSHQVDGHNGNEVVILRFDHTVRLVSAMFSYVGGDDGFDYFVDLGSDGSLDRVAQDVDIPNNNLFDFFALNLTGDIFGIGASYSEYEKWKKKKKWITHDWKLKAVTVEKIAEIPVPAALPLFLAGLGAIGWAKKRRKAA